MRWAEHVAHMAKMRNAYKICHKTCREETAQESYTQIGVQYKLNFKLMGCEIVDWNYLVQDRDQWQVP
jgi:hypothetical protein